MLIKKIRMIFCLLFLFQIVFAQNTTTHSVSKADLKSKIYVRDYKYFREYYYKDSRILVNKSNGKNKNFIFTQGQTVTSVKISENKAIIELMIPSKMKRHFILQKIEKGQKNKIGYYSVERKKYFNSLMPQAGLIGDQGKQICSRGPNWSFGDLAEISKVLGAGDSKKFSSIDVEDFIDAESCDTDSEDVKILKKNLDSLFKNNAKEMFSCLQKESAQKKLEQNPILLENANMFVARITRFLDERKFSEADEALGNKLKKQLSVNRKNEINRMKIMCAPNADLEGKSACFKDDNENPAIIIDLKKMKRDADEKIDSEDLKKVLVHEFYHTSNQQIETPAAPGCADHAVIKNLESLCDDTGKVDVSAKVRECLQQKTNQENFSGNITNTTVLETAATMAATSEALKNSAEGLNNLTIDDINGIQKISANIEPLSSPITPNSISTVNMNSGTKTEILSNAVIESAISSAYNTFSGNANSMTKALAGAIAVTTSTKAFAQTKSLPLSSAVTYAEPEIINDKFKIPDTLVVAKTQSSVQLLNSISNSTTKAKSAEAESAKLVSEATNSNPSSQNISRSINSVAPTADVNAKPSDRSIASVKTNNNQQTTVIKSVSNSESRILQTLSAVTKLSGQSYEDIKKMYDNADFKNSLAARGIVIELNDLKKTKIGANQKAKITFRDSGKDLSKIEGQ